MSAQRSALELYFAKGTAPSEEERGRFRYPELRVTYRAGGPLPATQRAYGKFQGPGVYNTTITQPMAFRSYLLEQLGYLVRDYDVTIEVGVSRQEIPYPYVFERGDELARGAITAADLALSFPTPLLASVGDEIADGSWVINESGPRPLALFDAVRVDYSLRRLVHYTGTDWRCMQPWILLTNYHRYVDQFVRWAVDTMRADGPWMRLELPGGVTIERGLDAETVAARIASSPWHRFQMPAYHLIRDDGHGVSLVNIGVGPSNAKNITDHLAVLRPHCWLMVGHCGGLRQSQKIGDYVLAHGYLRRDRILDGAVPPDIPVPALAEVQLALQEAAARVTGDRGEDLKKRPAHRHRGDLRRPQLGAPLEPGAAADQPLPRHRGRYGKRHHRGSRLSPARSLRHAALRLRQAASRRDQAAGRRERLLRARGGRAPHDRSRGPRHPARPARRPALPEIALLRRAAVPLGREQARTRGQA
jgi:AMP nucleosidase